MTIRTKGYATRTLSWSNTILHMVFLQRDYLYPMLTANTEIEAILECYEMSADTYHGLADDNVALLFEKMIIVFNSLNERSANFCITMSSVCNENQTNCLKKP